jgi:hypothetical protein
VGGAEREDEGADVAEHVRGVGEEGEGAGPQTDAQLDDEEQPVQDEGTQEGATHDGVTPGMHVKPVAVVVGGVAVTM